MKNFWLDVILFALLVAELSFPFLPKILHEILGVAMAATIIAHISLNFRRLMHMLKNLTPRKFFGVTIDFLLLICAAIILASGVCISNHLFPDVASFDLRRNMTIHQLHTAAAYVVMIVIGTHVGLHWAELRQKILSAAGLEGFYRRRRKFFRAMIILLSACGVAGLFLNRVGSRLTFEHIFATPATDLPAPLFMLLIIGGVTFFAAITRLADNCSQKI